MKCQRATIDRKGYLSVCGKDATHRVFPISILDYTYMCKEHAMLAIRDSTRVKMEELRDDE